MAMYAERSRYEYRQYGGSPNQFPPSAYGPTNYPKPTAHYNGIGSYQPEYNQGYGGGYKPADSNYGGAGSYGTGGGNYDGNGTHMSYQKGGDYRTPSYGIQEKPSGMLCQTEALNDPFFALAPSSFPPGTDPKIIDSFNKIDRDGNGFIDDRELQMALSNFNQRFSMRTVHLLMYMFTHSHSKTIGPKEFAPLLQSLGKWKAMFQRFDRDRNGRIDALELREALCSLGCTVTPMISNLLISKYDKQDGGNRSIEYDTFIEACLTIQGLTQKFKANEDPYSGTASFTCDEFLLSVLPFICT